MIDTSGHHPRAVARSAAMLASVAGHYTFVSSISAYRRFQEPRMREDTPTVRDPSDDIAEGYGVRKAECERAVAETLLGRACMVRPGLLAEGLEPWEDAPLWPDLPQHPELRGFMAVDIAHALANGLSFRPLEETVRDLLAIR